LDSPLIRLAGVGKRFANGTLALDGIDLTIGRGEFLALVGPSGCGKSTVLRLIAGLAQPSTGTVHRDGIGTPGFVFQDPTLMPWARILDNVMLPLRLAHIPTAEARGRAEAALQSVGLEGFARAYPRELSGGMRMRASIARALVTEPDLLLLDEPFAALDEITRLKLDDELLAISRQRPLTIVLVTHSVSESVYLADRIAIMSPRPGRVVEIAMPGLARGTGRLESDFAEASGRVSAALARAMAA
jgi:NitT/TauT family transport system ATP-binding protein